MADGVLLAGDIRSGLHGLPWADQAFDGTPTILIAGNHELYGSEHHEWYAHAGRYVSTRANPGEFSFLNNQAVTLHKEGERSVRILGATLWTDFAVFGEATRERNAILVQQTLNDFRLIKFGERIMRWTDTLALHQASLAWLKTEAKLAKGRGEKVVLVTHHGPSKRSCASQYLRDPVSAGFCSDLEAFAAEFVDLWNHGHMHNKSDYWIGKCRVIVNPRGYPRHRWNPDTSFENKEFNPRLVVEV